MLPANQCLACRTVPAELLAQRTREQWLDAVSDAYADAAAHDATAARRKFVRVLADLPRGLALLATPRLAACTRRAAVHNLAGQADQFDGQEGSTPAGANPCADPEESSHSATISSSEAAAAKLVGRLQAGTDAGGALLLAVNHHGLHLLAPEEHAPLHTVAYSDVDAVALLQQVQRLA